MSAMGTPLLISLSKWVSAVSRELIEESQRDSCSEDHTKPLSGVSCRRQSKQYRLMRPKDCRSRSTQRAERHVRPTRDLLIRSVKHQFVEGLFSFQP